MTRAVVGWTDEVDAVIAGDLTAAAAYVTDAGGVVLTPVAPCGLRRREEGIVGFTTSLGFPRKLERLARDPRVALTYHARTHGTATVGHHVLVQGVAVADVAPSAERLEHYLRRTEPYLGPMRRGPVWDRLLREYYYARVFLDVPATRVAVWEAGPAGGAPQVGGAAWPSPPAPQTPPRNGTGPRLDVGTAARRVAALPHRLLAYRGSDGFPVVVPVEPVGHDAVGLRLAPLRGTLPPGGRRAGLLAHDYRPRLVGLATRSFTGWLDVAPDGTARYSPHTTSGFTAPPYKNLLLVGNGLMAKLGTRRARRHGLDATLQALTHAAAQGDLADRGRAGPR
ncbi:MAG: hypothetical protein L0H64_12400 [Pseudonocardia sp.]|nr:hypothetical protein [Pseudonocardia sp.]